MATEIHVNGAATSSDWQDRYYHVDQILDRPGPRTDPSFLAGDEVSISQMLRQLSFETCSKGEGLFAEQVQDSCHRRRWIRMRNTRQSCSDWVQGYPSHRHGHYRHQQSQSSISLQVRHIYEIECMCGLGINFLKTRRRWKTKGHRCCRVCDETGAGSQGHTVSRQFIACRAHHL